MKINWGTGLVIALAAFICFIMYFVITMITDKDYNHDLVVEEYYKQEIGFQDELNAEQNAANLPYKIHIEKSTKGILLNFPQEIADSFQKGTIVFYRVSDKNMDFEKAIVLENNQMQIPASEVLEGRWNISVRWETENKIFLSKQEINY